MTNVTIKRALLSVSDKDGLAALGATLADAGVELISTGGTAKALRDAGLTENGRGAGLALPDGSYWQFRCGELGKGVTLSVEESLWVDGQGRPQPIEQLVIQGLAPRAGATFSWLFKKMG